MDQNNSRFFLILVVLMVIIIGMVIYIKPVTFFQQYTISDDAAYLKEGCMLNNKIKAFCNKNGNYPRSLKELIVKSRVNYDSLFSYSFSENDYMLRFNFPIQDTILVFSKESVHKYPRSADEE